MRLSRAYYALAWISLATAALLWLPFAAVASGFLWGGYLLRREGL